LKFYKNIRGDCSIIVQYVYNIIRGTTGSTIGIKLLRKFWTCKWYTSTFAKDRQVLH